MNLLVGQKDKKLFLREAENDISTTLTCSVTQVITNLITNAGKPTNFSQALVNVQLALSKQLKTDVTPRTVYSKT